MGSGSNKATSRRRPEENRRLLLEAAERATAREGRSVSLGAIAAEAGVSRSAMYRHFKSRDELLTEAALAPFVDFLDAFRAVAHAQIKSGSTIWEMERAFVSAIVNHFSSHHEYVSTVLSDRSVLDDALRARLFAEIDEVIAEISEVATELGAATGVSLEHIDIWVRFVIALAAGFAANERWLMPLNTAVEREAAIDNLTSFVLFGIQKPPPHGPRAIPACKH